MSNIMQHLRSFSEARKFAHSLHFSNRLAWEKYVLSGELPRDIPLSPNMVYKRKGWISWRDWLGTPSSSEKGIFRTFEDARKFAHTLGLKNKNEWIRYLANGNKRMDIPVQPDLTYKKKGWISWDDWLGYTK